MKGVSFHNSSVIIHPFGVSMELLVYWRFLRRRWLLIVIPAGIVIIIALITYQPPAVSYNVGVRFLVGQTPLEETPITDEQRLNNWQASEYVVNGLRDWVSGNRFGELVNEELAGRGIDVPAGAISGGLVTDNTRSMMTLSLHYHDPEVLAQMMDAAIVVMQTRNTDIPQLGGDPAVLVQLDEPIVGAIGGGLRQQLDLPLRFVLAIGAGVGLAFLVDFLDPTLRGREELEAMGLAIVGEIPKK